MRHNCFFICACVIECFLFLLLSFPEIIFLERNATGAKSFKWKCINIWHWTFLDSPELFFFLLPPIHIFSRSQFFRIFFDFVSSKTNKPWNKRTGRWSILFLFDIEKQKSLYQSWTFYFIHFIHHETVSIFDL